MELDLGSWRLELLNLLLCCVHLLPLDSSGSGIGNGVACLRCLPRLPLASAKFEPKILRKEQNRRSFV
jgi:hypothetical protein